MGCWFDEDMLEVIVTKRVNKWCGGESRTQRQRVNVNGNVFQRVETLLPEVLGRRKHEY